MMAYLIEQEARLLTSSLPTTLSRILSASTMHTDQLQRDTKELGRVPSSEKIVEIGPPSQRLDRNFSLLSICSVGIVTGST